MGLKEFTDNHRFDAAIEGYRISGRKLQKGGKSWLIAGATAEFEHGANVGSRLTATRVVLTGVFALALKKNKNKIYVMIELRGGERLLIEARAKDEKKVREFVTKFNKASEYFAGNH